MRQYGIGDPLLEWIGDFLMGRMQQTRVGAALSDITVIIMAALCNRAGHYIFALWFLSSSSIFFFPFSSPNLSRR